MDLRTTLNESPCVEPEEVTAEEFRIGYIDLYFISFFIYCFTI